MENQFNSATEQTNEVETLTYTVGQLPLQGTPRLNRVYADERVQMFLVDFGTGELTIHCNIKVKPTLSVIKHINEVFNCIVLGLIERGADHLDTWVEDDPKQVNFAEFFGFEETGYMRIIEGPDGNNLPLREMRFKFPNLDEE
jgi:hypothetical protein